jgi:hypothetical protein
MGLLDIWQDWKNDNIGQPIEDVARNSQYGSRLDTAGGVPNTQSSNILDPRNYGYSGRTIGRNTTNFPIPKSVAMSDPANVSAAMNSDRPGFPLKNEGESKLGINEEQSKRFFGMTLDEIKSNYKDKGGFDGLMANPAFTLGLAIMQSSAQGKRIDEKLLDNFVQAAGISETFKKKLADKSSVIEVTEGQMNKIKNVLSTLNISAPALRKALPGNQSEMYEQAVEDIAMKVQEKVNARIKEAQKSGKKIKVGDRLYKEIVNEMINNNEIDRKGGLKIGNIQLIDYTLEAKPIAGNREHGGPVQQGKPYVVGEAGPEVVIPTSDGNVLSNDDSQIFAMLLASNPQLQKVSKQRAERILRARFPEYFE